MTRAFSSSARREGSRHGKLFVDVVDDPPWLGLQIYVSRHAGTSLEILRLGATRHSETWERLDTGVEAEPTFRVDHDIAKTLLEALLDHYRGGTDTRTLRSDYEHERERADKLIAAITTIAIAEPPVPTFMEGPSRMPR